MAEFLYKFTKGRFPLVFEVAENFPIQVPDFSTFNPFYNTIQIPGNYISLSGVPPYLFRYEKGEFLIVRSMVYTGKINKTRCSYFIDFVFTFGENYTSCLKTLLKNAEKRVILSIHKELEDINHDGYLPVLSYFNENIIELGSYTKACR